MEIDTTIYVNIYLNGTFIYQIDNWYIVGGLSNFE